MSDVLDWRRLYWSGSKGRAVVNGCGADLESAPVICGKPVAQIDYLPSLGVVSIRRDWNRPMEDMTDAERADAEAILERATIPAWGSGG